MKKEKKYKFFNEGEEVCWIRAAYEQAHPFEVMLRRFLRYASRFGFNVRYESEDLETTEKEEGGK